MAETGSPDIPAKPDHDTSPRSRRRILQATAGLMAGSTLPLLGSQPARSEEPYRVSRNRIRQSVMGWCFKPMPALELARHCKSMGLKAIEGISPKLYPMVRKLGLDISLVSSHGFKTGFCNRDQHAACMKILRERIELAAEFGYKNVITFTGMLPKGVGPELATKNCVAGWKNIVGFAEKKGVNLCLEHLNTRDATHPMKGHPGYFGDDVDHCVDMIKQIGSPRMKLLFDVYHVQIMNGDVIRRIRLYKKYIGHYHTAGVPGRGELDETQEIQYPAVMKAIVASGFQGYVAQEFIPTWKDKIAALRQAVKLCDV